MKAIVGNDFVDAQGVRRFSFQICRHHNGRFEAVAVLDVSYGQDGVPSFRFAAIESLKRRQLGIQRLASIYMRRSVPVCFASRIEQKDTP